MVVPHDGSVEHLLVLIQVLERATDAFDSNPDLHDKR